ncbi:unnamed protein product [Schistocephalus solidus]|uniref:RRM domain-containing protein n=1 Tax=Schistocephalus solidus TaxID=70667 RepID=A0A183SLI6_SCHSO|nr:unnamed protein product [Schistocephalus solidus]
MMRNPLTEDSLEDANKLFGDDSKTSLHVQSGEHTARCLEADGTLVSPAGQALLGGSSNAPKFGTLIPNRIFVGGIPSNQELKTYFSSFGQVKDVKIINDRLGVAKGYVWEFDMTLAASPVPILTTLASLVKPSCSLLPSQANVFLTADVPTALFFTGGAIPCGFQNGMTVFPLAGQDYSLLAQPGSPYQSMLLQQANGTVYLSPQAGPTAAQYSALQSQLTHQGTLAALQQQQYHQASLQNSLAAGNPVAQNQAAVVAAAAAAVAAASQWPNSATSSSQSVQQLSAATHLTSPNPISNQTSPGLAGLDSQPQMAALAAAVAAQQQLAAAAAWRWPTAQPAGPAANPATNTVLASSPIVSTNSSVQAATSPTTTNAVISSANQQQVSNSLIEGLQQLIRAQQAQASQQQLLATAALLTGSPSQQPITQMIPQSFLTGVDPTTAAALAAMTAPTLTPAPSTLKCETPASPSSPAAGTGQEFMLIQQTNSPFTPNSTSDYSTDNSAHSSGFLESMEPGSFQCDISPSGRQSQSYGSGPNYTAPLELTYTTIPAVLDAISTPSATVGLSLTTQPNLHRQASHAPGILSMPTGQPLLTLATPQSSLLAPSQQHKLFATLPPSAVGHGTTHQNCQLGNTLYGAPQPIILDVFPSGFPLTQMKQGPVFSENAFSHSVDALGGPLKSTSQLLGCCGIPNHSVCLPTQQNGNRVNSPTKVTQPPTINVGKAVNGSNRGILENMNNSNSSTRAM